MPAAPLAVGSHVVNVLVWSDNRILAGLISRNLVRRGFDVDELPLPSAHAPSPPRPLDIQAALAIVDLDCQAPDLWCRAARIRTTIPRIPLVILGHAWPVAAQLDQLQPCIYVRKPFAIDELLAAIQKAPAAAGTHH
jgi:DNA-binding response OmpR family regulator